MPISAKKTIEIIRKNPDLKYSIKSISQIHESMRKKQKEAPLSAKDLKTIEQTLEFLSDIGYLVRSKKHYTRSKEFLPRAEIVSVDRNTASAIIYGMHVTIRKEYLSRAGAGDAVNIEIYDVKKNQALAKVKKVWRKKSSARYAIVDKVRGSVVFSRLPGDKDDIITASRRSIDVNEGDIVLIAFKNGNFSGHMESEILEKIDAEDEAHDIARVISDHMLPPQYPDTYSEETFIKSVPQDELKNRADFRKMMTVTIDGETAKDFDDAISFKKEKNHYLLHVHIADVSAYVRANSEIDLSAMKRGTSYYLGKIVVPMLPEVLSNNLCSLRENEDRLALTAILKYDFKANLIDARFTRSTIRVNKRLTYKSANDLINSEGDDEISSMLKLLAPFAENLKKQRIKSGRIDLTLTDSELIFHEGKFTDIILSQRLQTHNIIEECMLSANVAVANALKHSNIAAVYRVHEKMSEENVYVLEKFFRSINIAFRADKGHLGISLQRIIEKVRGLPNEQVINFVILKSMMQAYYGTEPEGHFGLGFPDYTHFTSPIRRYPDLLVHRCLKAMIDKSKAPYSLKKLGEMAEISSKTERVGQRAERDLFKLKSARLMKPRIGETFEAIISGIGKFGIYVALKEKPVEGMVPFKYMNDDYYRVIEDTFTAIGQRTKRKYTLGDKISVRLVKSDPVLKQIDFEVVKNSKK